MSTRSGKFMSAANLAAFQTLFETPPDRAKPLFNDANRNQSMKTSVDGLRPSSYSPLDNPNLTYKNFAVAASGAPPVIFKLISSITNSRGVTDLFNYLNKEEGVELETGFGDTAISLEEVAELATEWRTDIEATQSRASENTDFYQKQRQGDFTASPEERLRAKSVANKGRVLLRHAVIVYPKNTLPEQAMSITRQVAIRELGERGLDYVMAGHFAEEGENPHVHLAFRTNLPDGTKFSINKERIFGFRQSIADEAQVHGITLHQGMAWERGKQPENIARQKHEIGLRPSKQVLSNKNKQQLDSRLAGVNAALSKATNRTRNLDPLIFKHLKTLSPADEPHQGQVQQEQAKERQLGRPQEADYGMEP